VQATYRFQLDTPLSSQIEETWRQVDLSGQWTFSSQWKGLWRWNYDLKKGKLLEALGGVEYTKGCWGIRAVGQHLVTSETTSTKAFFLQLELDGLGQLGSNPMDVLRRSIPGYVENRPAALMIR
jgi:LPS-assembly protein